MRDEHTPHDGGTTCAGADSSLERPSGVPGGLLVLSAAALFSTGGAAIKACSLSAAQVAGLRSALAALVLLLFPGVRRTLCWRVLPVGVTYSATMILYVAGNKLTTAANTIFLQSTAPLYLLLLGPWLLRERIARRDVLFLLLVAGGMACFFIGVEAPQVTAPDPALGNLLATAAGLTWALTVAGLRVLGRRAPGPGAPLAATLAGNAITALVCLPWLFPLAPSAGDIAAIGYLGTVQIALAYLCLSAGVRRVTALRASLLLLLEPVLNPIWAWLVHGERPGEWALVGAAIILGATTWTALPRRPSNG